MKQRLLLLMIMLLPNLILCAERMVRVETTMGPVILKLYDDTPLHRDNFVKLVENGDYNGVLFHRVIKDFMVQAGDPNSKEGATSTAPLGSGSIGEKITAEINFPTHYHKYGALAAARDGNPQKRSSGSQFYIVTGRKFDRETAEERVRTAIAKSIYDQMVRDNQTELKAVKAEGGVEALRAKMAEYMKTAESQITTLPEEIINSYIEIGGTPHLDNDYTVFGEVVEGMDVVEKIQNAPTNAQNLPEEPIRIISMEMIQ